MQVRALVILLLVSACAHPRNVRGVDMRRPPGTPEATSETTAAASLWPVPMRVMAWTTDGVVQRSPRPGTSSPSASTAISDKGARILDSLPKLTGLGLGMTSISGATLDRIGKLTELRTLVLQATHTDKLEQLGALHVLQRLYLTDTNLDDATFTTLRSCTSSAYCTLPRRASRMRPSSSCELRLWSTVRSSDHWSSCVGT